jgi:Na+-driven multidrug efflux pump
VIGMTWAMIADWAIHAALIALRYRSGKWKIFQVI